MKKMIILVFLFFAGCKKSNNDSVTVKYYSSFAGYNHPVKLIDELRETKIKEKKSYYVGTYNGERLIKVEKILIGKTVFIYNYSYDNNGKLSDVKIFKPNK